MSMPNRPRSAHVEPAVIELADDLAWVRRLKSERQAELIQLATERDATQRMATASHWHALRCAYQQEPFVNDPLQIGCLADLPVQPPATFHPQIESWHVAMKVPGHASLYTIWEFRSASGWKLHRRSYGEVPFGVPEWWIDARMGLIPYRHLADALEAAQEL